MKKYNKRRLNRIINIVKAKPKKFIFKRNKVTVVLPTKDVKPILRKSELFNNEYEKEKSLLGWK